MSLPDDIQMDKDNILLFGLTACALGLSLFILLGPKLGRRNASNCALVGLQNLGLTCFLNSLLQALASCPSFIDWLQSGEGNGNVSESLYSILKLLCYEKQPELEEIYSPDSLIENLRGKAWPTFPQEQDPHELFLHILTSLEEEEQKSTPERIESLLDALGPLENDFKTNFSEVTSHGDVPRVKRNLTVEIKTPKLTPSPFRGYLASQLSCSECGNKSAVVYDKFDSLSLALPSRGETFKLQRLLDDFVSAEIVEGFACDHCNKGRDVNIPPKLSQASKAIKIGKLPKCLCLHISRTYMDSSGYMYKRENYVDFPEYLSMYNYTHTNSMLMEKKLRKNLMSPSICHEIKFPKSSQSASVLGGNESDPTLTKFKTLNSPDESDFVGLSSEEEFETPPSQASDFISLPSNNNTLLNNTNFYLNKRLLEGPRYRLKGVIEHRGTVETGHFVTYRRGPLQSDIRHRSSELHNQSESRWYFTSDEIVRTTKLADALSAHAYLLFYEKCSSPHGY